MPRLKSKEEGLAIFMVLSILLVVTVLVNVILAIISSQARFTHHQVSRIKAFYATQAGVNYALEKLRRGDWTYSSVNSCPKTAPCEIPDSDLSQTKIIFCPSGERCAFPPNPDSEAPICTPLQGATFCVRANTTYTYP